MGVQPSKWTWICNDTNDTGKVDNISREESFDTKNKTNDLPKTNCEDTLKVYGENKGLRPGRGSIIWNEYGDEEPRVNEEGDQTDQVAETQVNAEGEGAHNIIEEATNETEE